MRRTLVLVVFLTVALRGQTVEGEGRAWLDARPDPAEISVNGIWQGGTWGSVTLNQVQGGREVSGKGDAWDVKGVVSGKKVFLLFFEKGKVAYSAELSAESAGTLDGRYADGLLSSRSSTQPMRLSKLSANARGCKGEVPNTDRASVVVYRISSMVGVVIKPSVFCDAQEVALMYSGRFFSVALSPGTHSLSLGALTPVSLEAKPGVTYYVRIAPGFSIKQVDSATALKELAHLKPADAKHVIMPDIVSIAAVPGK